MSEDVDAERREARSVDGTFAARAAVRYVVDTQETLAWILGRIERRRLDPPGAADPAGYVDTKVSPLTLEDYTARDGLRGPDHVYGWIQGRALEALCIHAAHFERSDPALAARLDAASARLHDTLDTAGDAARRAPERHADGAAFCRRRDGTPICTGATLAGKVQRRESGIRTYADVFVVKGLIAAAHRHARRAALARHLAELDDIVAAVDEGRFLRDESGHVDGEALARQREEYGPRMILLGASALLRRLGLAAHDGFSGRFVERVLARHLHRPSGLLTDKPGGALCNVGHGVELVGLALETLGPSSPRTLARRLRDVLLAHAEAGFRVPGIALTVDVATGRETSPYRPWWSLPETIRAAALCHERLGGAATLAIWRRADADYFARYRRRALPIAYQTLTADGPVDHVPATPDLDPAYHTGLSLMAAVESIERRDGAAAAVRTTPARTEEAE